MDHEVSLLLTGQLIWFILHREHNQYFTTCRAVWASCVSIKHGSLKEHSEKSFLLRSKKDGIIINHYKISSDYFTP